MSSIPASGMDAVSPLFSIDDPWIAQQLNASTFIHIGSTAVLAWDVINNIGSECRLISRHKARFSAIIYFCARISLMTYMIGRSVFLTAPIPPCQAFLTFLNVALIINVSAITSLYTLRLWAVYNMAKAVILIFGLLWLGGVGLGVKFAQSFQATHIGTSGFCQEIMNGSFLGPFLAGLLFNDTLIFIFITYRGYKMYLESGAPICHRFEVFCFGKSVPILTKALLQDSQFYSFTSVISLALSVFFAFNFQGPLQMFVVFHMVVANMLCGKIFRKIRTSANVHAQVLPTVTGNLQSMDFPATSTNGKEITASIPVFLQRSVVSMSMSLPGQKMYTSPANNPRESTSEKALASNSTLEEDIAEPSADTEGARAI